MSHPSVGRVEDRRHHERPLRAEGGPPTKTASELRPSQRTFDETLTVVLALFSHSDNVLSKHRADGIAATIQVNPDL